MKEITSVTVGEIFNDARFNEISCLILDVERAGNIGEKHACQRQVFKNHP